MLKLNNDKTEVMLFSSRYCQQTASPSVRIGDDVITPSSSVRNLGVTYDKSLTMDKHINAVSRSCYAQLRNIGQIRRFLDQDSTKSLIHALVTSRLDYCNALLYGLPDVAVAKLQRIQNTAARIITRTSRYEHITPVLQGLHWLPIKRRMEYKIIMHTFRALHNQSPEYMQDMITQYRPTRTLRSQSTVSLVIPRASTVTYGARSFTVSASKLWNTLPSQLSNINKIDTFRNALKTYLFKLEYGL